MWKTHQTHYWKSSLEKISNQDDRNRNNIMLMLQFIFLKNLVYICVVCCCFLWKTIKNMYQIHVIFVLPTVSLKLWSFHVKIYPCSAQQRSYKRLNTCLHRETSVKKNFHNFEYVSCLSFTPILVKNECSIIIKVKCV